MVVLIIGIILMVLGCTLSLYSLWKIKRQVLIDEVTLNNNRNLQEEQIKLLNQRSELLKAIDDLETERNKLAETAMESALYQQSLIADSLEKFCDNLETAYLAAENSFDTRLASLTAAYQAKQENLEFFYNQSQKEHQEAFNNYIDILLLEYKKAEQEYDSALAKIDLVMQEKKGELDKLAATWLATREAQAREEELRLKSDFYCLHLTETNANTIKLIEELKPRLPEPRVLSMLIWSTYFQKQTTALCNNVLGINKVCGIYKITNLKSGLCYIGQSTDIADRWKTHIKCGLGIDTPVQNKLYKAMQTDGIVNFTFELLEKCDKQLLNEKEKFYIDLYKSYNYGYNSTQGNK